MAGSRDLRFVRYTLILLCLDSKYSRFYVDGDEVSFQRSENHVCIRFLFRDANWCKVVKGCSSVSNNTRISRRAVILAALAAAGSLSAARIEAQTPTPTPNPLPPPRPTAPPVSVTPNPLPTPRPSPPTVALGATITGDIPGTATLASYLRNYTQVVGGLPTANLAVLNGLTTAVLNYYDDWSHGFDQHQGQFEAIRAVGATPMLSWNSMEIDFGDIINGTFDTYLNGYADAAKADGKTFLMRFDWEMNGNFFPWGRWTAPGGQGGDDASIAARYVTMWRHVVDRFRARGAINVRWVWCPNVIRAGVSGSYPNGTGPASPVAVSPSAWYPGDAYVDWIGMDGYNFGTTGGPNTYPDPSRYERWESFRTVFGTTYQAVTALSATKPVLIGEVGCAHRPDSANPANTEAKWIRDAFLTDLPQQYPRIRCVLWYNIDKRKEEMNPDWRIAGTTVFTGMSNGTPQYQPAMMGYRPGNDPLYPGQPSPLPPGVPADPCDQAAIDAYKEVVANPYFRATLTL